MSIFNLACRDPSKRPHGFPRRADARLSTSGHGRCARVARRRTRPAGAAARRPVHALRQSRQRGEHAAAAGGARCRSRVPAVLRQRPSRVGLQIAVQHRRLRRCARDDRSLRRRRRRRRIPSSLARTPRKPSTSSRSAIHSRQNASCSRRRWSTIRTTCRGGAAPSSSARESLRRGASISTTSRACLRDTASASRWSRSAAPRTSPASCSRFTRLARKAHAVGARILVDAAQLAPHRRMDMRADGDPEHLDFVALSAHKMYAPFGTGALVGSRDVFLASARRNIAVAARSRSSRPPRCNGPACPIARKQAARMSSAPSPWPPRPGVDERGHGPLGAA